MRRARHAGHKEQLACMLRPQYEAAAEHELRGTIETIACDVNDFVSVYDCPCSVPVSRTVDHEDSKRATTKTSIIGEASCSPVREEGRSVPVVLEDLQAVSCSRQLPRIRSDVVLVNRVHYIIRTWRYQ